MTAMMFMQVKQPDRRTKLGLRGATSGGPISARHAADLGDRMVLDDYEDGSTNLVVRQNAPAFCVSSGRSAV
jgi:hypothetical protein